MIRRLNTWLYGNPVVAWRQIVARMVTFLLLTVMGGWVLVACLPAAKQNACFPNCNLTVAPPVATDIEVAIYGDSRGWYLAEGARSVPGWHVTNDARQGCAWLGQTHLWKRYFDGQMVTERSTSQQTTGQTLACDTRAYIPTAPTADVALVYAGSLLTVDNGTTSTLHSPLDPVWVKYMEDNLVTTLRSIHAKRVIVLGTPVSAAHSAGFTAAQAYWSHQDRIDAVNRILQRAAGRADVGWMPAFVDWVNAQPKSCQPDGSHFTPACGLAAGLWIKANIG